MVIGPPSGPAPSAQARVNATSATRSSWRTCPKVNARRNVPSVEGAITRWPSTAVVAPELSRSTSSMQSAPARVGAPGSSTKVDQLIGQRLKPEPLGQDGWQQQAGIGDRMRVVEGDLKSI
jgi:hypothetical protein